MESKGVASGIKKQEGTFLCYAYQKETIANNETLMKETILKKNYRDLKNCPVRSILDRIGDKWSILVLMFLQENGKMRFNELSREIEDVSQKMLTVTLRTLEADGLVKRTVFPEVPPRVEYELTVVGKSLLPHINSLTAWATTHFSTIQKSRSKFAS